MTATYEDCGARRPGWEDGPAIGRHRIPCVRVAGHDGPHRDGLTATWDATEADATEQAAVATNDTEDAMEDLERITPESPEEQADILFDSVSDALRDHGDSRATKADLRDALVHADETFQRLHEWITAGHPLPDPWRKRYAPTPET